MAKGSENATIKSLKERRKDATKERDATKHLRDEGYRYAIPFRQGQEDNTPGASRVDDVFDHTAIDAAFRFAGKLQQNIWPAGQQNFELAPGPLVPTSERDEWVKFLSGISEFIHGAFFDDGYFDNAYHEHALDLSVGTGAILMNSTAYGDAIWEPISVPVNELLLEQGAFNRISGVFWSRKMSVRQLFQTYPNAQFGEVLKKLRKDKPNETVIGNYDSSWEPAREPSRTRWRHVVWCDKQEEAPIDLFETRASIWAVERYFRVPGEVWGRGPVMLAMPSIKTLNTAKRLQLQAAAIALLGIYTAIDDGVFNPDNSPLTPGSFMKVARNGGPLGPSIARLPDPRLDLTGLVIENMQMDVKATMMDQALPTESAAVKSATEIMERVKRLASDHVGAYGRLIKEGVEVYVKRAIEIAYERQLISTNIPIDQILVKVKVKSPLALSREMERVQKIVQWLEMVLAILGDPKRLDEYAKIEKILPELGNAMGVPADMILSGNEREAVQNKKLEQQLTMAAAAAGGQALEGGAA